MPEWKLPQSSLLSLKGALILIAFVTLKNEYFAKSFATILETTKTSGFSWGIFYLVRKSIEIAPLGLFFEVS